MQTLIRKNIGIDILIPNKLDFRAKMITRDKEQCTMIKESTHRKDKMTLYIYVSYKIHEAKIDRSEKRKRYIYNECEDFNMSLSATDKVNKQIISKIIDLNNRINRIKFRYLKHST